MHSVMARRMVIVPYSMAKAMIAPIVGHQKFDLKDNADPETINTIHKHLNLKEGEKEKDEPNPEEKKEEAEKPEIQKPKPTPKPRDVKAQVKAKLLKTNGFNPQSKAVFSVDGKEVANTNIDNILDHAFGTPKTRHPKGSKEIAERMNLLGVTGLPNTHYQAIVSRSTPTTPRTRKGTWKKF